MIRSELKKKAQNHLHGFYGNWSLIVFIPTLVLFIYLLCMGNFFQTETVIFQKENYMQSRQHSMDIYEEGYEEGYDEGYEEGYDDAYYDDYDYDDYEDYEDGKGFGFNKKKLNSVSINSAIIPVNKMSQSVTYQQTVYLGGGIVWLLTMIMVVVIVLYTGMVQWAAIDNVAGRSFHLKTTFIDFFKNNGKRVVSANLLIILYTFLWSLLFVIPGIVKQLSYSMTNYLLKKDPTLTPKEAMNLSQALMRGYRLEYLIFSCSFILWQLATIISFGLATIYVMPYYKISEVLFFDQIIKEKHYLFTQEKEAGFQDF